MFSSTIHGHLAQARVEELHHATRSSARRSAAARPDAEPLSMRVKRTLSRFFDVGLPTSDEATAIPGVQLIGHPATNRSRRS